MKVESCTQLPTDCSLIFLESDIAVLQEIKIAVSCKMQLWRSVLDAHND